MSAYLLRAPARGLTLIELMISTVIGLLIVLAAGALLAGSNSSYLDHAQTARLNDGARYALEIMTRSIRQTAYVNWDNSEGPVGVRPEDAAPISGLDARSISKNSEGIDNAVDGAVNGSDVIAVRYFGSGSGSNGDGSIINCAGFGVSRALSESERGWSIFYVATDATGEAELRCKYRGDKSWGADAIVRGVDSFQVLYGIDTDTPADGIANQFINASGLKALDDALALSGESVAARQHDLNRKTHWKRVVSIRVALLLHGDADSAGGAALGRFDLFGKEYSDAFGSGDAGVRINEAQLSPDLRRRARQHVEATIVLRNRPA